MTDSGSYRKSGDDVSREIMAATEPYVLRDTVVVGPIVCSDRTIECAILFENCTIDFFDCSRATLHRAISFVECIITVISIEDATIKGEVIFSQGTCEELKANRSRIAGQFNILGTELINLSCGGVLISSEMVVTAHVKDTCSFEGTRGTGKLDLTSVFVHRNLSLRHSEFDVIFLDHATVRGTLEAGRVVIHKSLYARHIEVGSGFSLKGAKIGGQALLHEAQITGEVNVSGLRCTSLHMNRGRIDGGLRGRGVAIEDGFLLKMSVIGNQLVLKGAVLGEISLFGSELNDVIMFDVKVRGSAIFGLQTSIEQAGHIAPHVSPDRPPSNDAMIAQLELRSTLRARNLHCDGIQCESLLLDRAQVDNIVFRNATVQSLLDLTELSCVELTVEMSKIAGNLRGRKTNVAKFMKLLSSEVDSVSIFEGVTIARFESRDSNYKSLVFTAAKADEAEAIRSHIPLIELDEVRAGIINLSDVADLDHLQIKASVATRLDLKTLRRLPRRLSITTSQIGVIEFDETPRYMPRAARSRKCRERYSGCEIDLNGTTFSAVSCDVESLLSIWLPTKTSATSRPSLAILESALRSSGYDDWADDVYQEFRRQVRRDPHEFRLHKVRNYFADLLMGYGFSTRKALVFLILPVAIAFTVTTFVPRMTALITPPPARAQVLEHPPVTSAAELVLRSYLPAGGSPETLEYRRCTAMERICPDVTGAILRACGVILFPLFFATLVGLLRYTDRRVV